MVVNGGEPCVVITALKFYFPLNSAYRSARVRLSLYHMWDKEWVTHSEFTPKAGWNVIPIETCTWIDNSGEEWPCWSYVRIEILEHGSISSRICEAQFQGYEVENTYCGFGGGDID